jgi:Cu(I)/Ag(I) efflux system membrane fusion protein
MKLKYIVASLIFTLLLSACGDETGSINANDGSNSDRQEAQYTCAMHPHYISTDADGSCPICGMGLVPAKDNNPEVKKADDIVVTVSQNMIQTMSVRTSFAEVVAFSRTLRAFGTVEANERLETVSASRIEGWVENLSVSAVGDSVSTGDLLYKVYSPELISAQRDYLSALSTRNNKRIESVKQRLLSIGMQGQVLAQLAQRKKVIERVPVYAETDGVVVEMNVRNGDYVKPGKPMLRLQSYVTVWIIASIPETDLSSIENGQLAKLRFPSAPNAASKGQVDYIYPTIDPKTRTAKVRIEVDNSVGLLLPGAYADIALEFSKKPRLSIVSEALLRDSRGEHVILALGEGRFESRSVIVGVRVNDRAEILQGLNEGDEVVASGQFMLDSEVNLREGLLKLSSATAVQTPESSAELAPSMSTTAVELLIAQKEPLSELEFDANTIAQFDHFVDAALYLHDSIINGTAVNSNFLDPAITLAEELKTRVSNDGLIIILNNGQAALRAAKLSNHTQALTLELAQLISAIRPWLLNGAPEHYQKLGLVLYQETLTGRMWLQNGGEIANPYRAQGAEDIGIVETIEWVNDSHHMLIKPPPQSEMNSAPSQVNDHADHQ